MARIPPPPPPTTSTGEVEPEPGRRLLVEDDHSEEDALTECGVECRNRLQELDHPKEEERCGAGQVLDIWGYCRLQHNVHTIPTQHNVNKECSYFYPVTTDI